MDFLIWLNSTKFDISSNNPVGYWDCLRIYSFHFSISATLIKQRVYKELWKSIQSSFQSIIWDVEHIASNETICEGVGLAWILWNVIIVLSFIRELFSTHEEHMLTEMCKTLSLHWVFERSHIHTHCCTWFISFRIWYKQANQFIWKFNHFINTCVDRAF